MRAAGIVFAMLMLTGGLAAAQQELAPSTSDGPLAIKPEKPQPETDGAYRLGPGIESPVLVRAAQAAYPVGSSETDAPHAGRFTATVGVDGAARNIQPAGRYTSLYDEPAITAIRQSQFEPGTLDGKPVPVQVEIRVLFSHLRPAFPTVVQRSVQMGGMRRPGSWQSLQPGGQQQTPQDTPLRLQRGDTPPKPLNVVVAEFTPEARKKKIQGVVLVSVLVTEEGTPIDPKVEKSLDPGLDEKAIESALQYTFQPATHDGVPIAVRISIEVNFRLN